MIELIKDDITKIEVDTIVNTANTSLLGGGGVDGAIHKAGGETILEDCQKIRSKQGGCKVGEAVITTAGKLPKKNKDYIFLTLDALIRDFKNKHAYTKQKSPAFARFFCLSVIFLSQFEIDCKQ